MIREHIGDAAMYEMLAEEAAELAHAALKMARVMRGENPTPVSVREAEANLEEEYTDVQLCAMDMGITADPVVLYFKMQRFSKRKAESDHEKAQEMELVEASKLRGGDAAARIVASEEKRCLLK